jgi:predicted peptidase
MLAAAPVLAADAKTGFVDKVYKNPDGHESPFVLFVPAGYDGTKPVPVVLFLHGAGETKGGKKMPVQQGIGNHIRGELARTFPGLVVIPQAETRGWQAEGENGKRAIAMLDQVMAEYKVDPDRQYLTGLSMGGYGTWSAAAAYPDRWAAIVPICGGGDPKQAERIKHLPCWAWHGDQDKAVPVERSREMVAALKAAGGQPRYTELAHIAHESWDAAYASPDLYTWLFKQVRPKSK